MRFDQSSGLSRRRFLAGAGAAALSFSIMPTATALGSRANSTVQLGLIGCGGRGSWIASLFEEQGGFKVAGIADYFRDRADAGGAKFKVAPAQRYTGLMGYQRLLAQPGIDAVAIESPPYFHPEQARAAVEANKHVYLAKPVAVDAPGCRTVEDSAREAKARKLAFLIDFQTRQSPLFQEALRRVHAGDIGKIAWGEAAYLAGSPWSDQDRYLEEDPRNPENRLRAWGLDRTLSGDIIVEQNIHTIDVMNWIMQAPPEDAAGIGGRTVRRDKGNCWDHFTVLYRYPEGVGMNFASRQFEGHGTQEGITNRAFGQDGVLETNYFGEVKISGNKPLPVGTTGNLYRDGAFANIIQFHDDITKGRYDHPTVAPGVQSNMLCILGREASYQRATLRWDDLLKDTTRLEADLSGLVS